jgi:hypothetical protein
MHTAVTWASPYHARYLGRRSVLYSLGMLIRGFPPGCDDTQHSEKVDNSVLVVA